MAAQEAPRPGSEFEELVELDLTEMERPETPPEASTEATTQAPKRRFEVTDLRSADWAARRYHDHEVAIAAKKAEVAKEIERWQTYLTAAIKPHQQAMDYLVAACAQFHYAQYDPNAKKPVKTIKLPCGAQFRIRQPKPEFQFDAAVTPWLQTNRPAWLQKAPPPPPDKAAIKKGVVVANGRAIDKETGEPIPGIVVVNQSATFKIKFAAEDEEDEQDG